MWSFSNTYIHCYRGFIFVVDDMYLPSLSSSIDGAHHEPQGEGAALPCYHGVSPGINSCGSLLFFLLVRLLHEPPYATVNNINVIFTYITGCEYLIVNGVFFGVLLVLYWFLYFLQNTLYDNCVDLLVPYPAPPDAFVVTVDGFLLPKEDMVHVCYTCLPFKTATLFMNFRVPCPFINALGTLAVYGKNSTP
jgi:hypothetical protein